MAFLVLRSVYFERDVVCEADSANAPDHWTLSRPCEGPARCRVFQWVLGECANRMMCIYRESRAVWAF